MFKVFLIPTLSIFLPSDVSICIIYFAINIIKVTNAQFLELPIIIASKSKRIGSFIIGFNQFFDFVPDFDCTLYSGMHG